MGVQYIDLGYNATGTVQTIRVGKDISLFGAHAVTPVAPTISVSANTINANEMYVNVTITSNVDWSMVVSTGTTIGTYTGTGDTELQVTVGQNIDRSGNGSARTIEFVVTNEAGSASTSVVQSKTYVIVGTYQSTGATTQKIAYNPVYFSVDDEVSITYSAGYNFQDADAHTIKIYVYEPNPRKQYWFHKDCNYLDLTIPDFESFLDLYQDVPEGGSAQNYVSYLYPSTGLTGNASLTGITFNGTGLIGPQVWIPTNSGGFYFPTAFSNCNALQSVTMINCGGIAWASFVGCTALTDVTITSTGNTLIGKNAFMSPAISMPGQGFDDYYCPISALTISGATLYDGAFAGSSALTSATLNSVAFDGNGHFGNCTALVDVTMTLHPSVIGQQNTFAKIFSGCTSMVRLNSNTDGEFAIPWGFTNMGGKVFDTNANLVTLVIPRSMTGFTANGACSAATNLNAMYASDAQGNRSGSANTIFIHNALSLPSESNFRAIKGTNAFKRVVFEGGRTSVCSIGTGQFRESTKITGVTGTSEVDWSYGTALFFKCTGLVRVDGWSVPTNWPHESNTRAVRGTSFAGCTKFQYINTDGVTDVVVPEGVEKIGPSCFTGDTKITSISLPSTLYNDIYGYNIDTKSPFSGTNITTILSYSTTAPTIAPGTSLAGMPASGTLHVQSGSTGYDAWMTDLGAGWTLAEDLVV